MAMAGMGTWLQSLDCLQERVVETRRLQVMLGMSQEEKNQCDVGMEEGGVRVGVDRGVVSISQGHQAWLQRLQGWA